MSRVVSGSFVALVPAIAIGAVVVCLGGCGQKATDLDDVSYHAISRNITPESRGLAERAIDQDRNMRMTMNQNFRLMWGDLGRMWLTDRPSALSPQRAVGTGGQPR